MNTQKVAITMPKDLIDLVDTISRKKGVSRSKFISSTIREKLDHEKKRELKEVYDRVFSDEAIQKEQLESAQWYEGLGKAEGQEW